MRQTHEAKPLVLVAAAALVRDDGRILLAQRPEGKPMAGLWEFPGGKVEGGERLETALVRELREELAIEVEETDLVPFTFASHRYDRFDLLMPLFLCRRWQGDVVGSEGQQLAWVAPSELRLYPAPEADIPLFARIEEWSRGGNA
jgi:8-oxo-dGTP diphosphatase